MISAKRSLSLKQAQDRVKGNVDLLNKNKASGGNVMRGPRVPQLSYSLPWASSFLLSKMRIKRLLQKVLRTMPAAENALNSCPLALLWL